MINVGSGTAILFFTRNESQEVRLKSFGSDRTKSAEIARSLIRRTRNLLERSPFPFFEIGSTERSVNEGFAEALEKIWKLGYDRIISVGNDCPQLRIADLHAANQLLDSNGLVVGPDHRGGVYLLGINKSIYDRQLFLNLPWHTNRFLSFLESHFSTTGFLQPLRDINGFRDLLRPGNPLRKTFLRFLTELIISIRSHFDFPARNYQQAFSQSVAKRGPPFFC